MSSWRLPTRLEVGGKAYPIHSDYRDILDILHRLNDASEPEFIRWRVALALFYEGDLPRSDYPEAMQKLADFLNCGQTLPRSPAPPLLDWEQDAPLIAAGINKAAGCEVRALPYLHWWTFMAWFNSIGDGQLATLLRVRSKLRHGQKLQPWEQDYYRKNKAMVDLRPRLNPAEIAERQLPYGHGEKSVYLIEHFMRLKTDEAIAIRWHMGGFDDAVRGGSFAVSDAYNRYPLAVKLHASDLIATYLMEQGTSNVENGHPKTK